MIVGRTRCVFDVTIELQALTPSKLFIAAFLAAARDAI